RSFGPDDTTSMTDIATPGCLTPWRTPRSSKATRAALARRRHPRSGFATGRGQDCVETRGRALSARLHEACALAADKLVRPVRAFVVCDVSGARDLAVAHCAAGDRVRRIPGAHLHH